MASIQDSNPQQIWRAKNNLIVKAKVRDALLRHPMIRAALTAYLNSLNLQGQVNQGIMTETQALVAFEKAIHQFSRQLHSELNKRYTTRNFDESNLSNSFDMQKALNNPLSLLNQYLNSTVAIIADAVAEEFFENEQANIAQQQTMQDIETQQTAPEAEPTITEPESSTKSDLKYAAVVGAIIAFEDHGPDAEVAKEKMESAFFKETGLKSDFHKVDEEKKHDNDEKKKYELKPHFDQHTEKKEQEK